MTFDLDVWLAGIHLDYRPIKFVGKGHGSGYRSEVGKIHNRKNNNILWHWAQCSNRPDVLWGGGWDSEETWQVRADNGGLLADPSVWFSGRDPGQGVEGEASWSSTLSSVRSSKASGKLLLCVFCELSKPRVFVICLSWTRSSTSSARYRPTAVTGTDILTVRLHKNRKEINKITRHRASTSM